jgi:AAA+ ATPase superfamily predicted ATPase
MKEIKSPFKFLDPYNKNDYKFFFGRKKEVFQLYDFVNKSRIVLLYGQSGTGKTSIIQCGLANEFEVTDWNPYYIRREDNLNDSFLNIIKNNFAEPSE